MPQAARVGDTTSHGTPLAGSPGSANVLIGGAPAWRAGMDFHTCPLVVPGTPPIPHVGGMVQVGSTSVFIGGASAARQGDTIMESPPAPPNSISVGCPTVMIG